MKILNIGLLALAAVSLLSAPRAKAATGKAIFEEKCISCHGKNGLGQTPAGKALGVRAFNSEEVQKQSDAELATAIKKGKGKMRAFEGDLSDHDIQLVAAYVRTFAKGK